MKDVDASAYKIVDVNQANIEEYDVFCLKSKRKSEGYRNKVKWVKERFKEGLRLKLLLIDEGPKRGFTSRGFIEYIPGAYTWRGIYAKGYMVIHCIWVVGRNKKHGHGFRLLEQCLNDAKGMNGVAVVTSEEPWLTSKSFFLKHGFRIVQKAPPYFELLVRQFEDAPLPRFNDGWEKRAKKYGSGLAVVYSDQCPYIDGAIRYISAIAKKHEIPLTLEKLDECTHAQFAPGPSGVFSLLYNDEFVTHRPGLPTKLLRQILRGKEP